ncbi:MAG: CBS domain-containing protein [Planctomycetales bacterium]|nr:CBS domain-containing protein [Planctomycetales bacterium]
MDLVVSGVMNKNVVAANANMSLEELGSLFVEHRFSGFPVVDDDELIGVVTKSDLVKGLYPQYDITKATFSDANWSQMIANSLGNIALTTSVADVMTRDVITVKPQDNLRDAADLMYENRIHRVFVVKNNRLVGVLAPFDFVRLYSRNRLIAGRNTPTLDF